MYAIGVICFQNFFQCRKKAPQKKSGTNPPSDKLVSTIKKNAPKPVHGLSPARGPRPWQIFYL